MRIVNCELRVSPKRTDTHCPLTCEFPFRFDPTLSDAPPRHTARPRVYCVQHGLHLGARLTSGKMSGVASGRLLATHRRGEHF